jgi:DNA-binding NarL/FixJ family response regulator
MIRLVLIDDHPVVIGGLGAALEPHTGLQIVGRAGSVAEARTLLAQQHADVALLDIRLPDGTGFELLEESVVPSPTAIIMLTTFHTSQYLATAMRLGAKGYLLKTAPIEEIVDAVRRVAAGGVAFMTEGEAVGDTTQRLSAQEGQIVRAVAAGLTNKEIAAQLTISRRTVEWHLAKLFERLAVRSRSELAARAVQEGWLELP